MKEKVRKGFYALYVVLLLVIIAENIWIGKGHLVTYNFIALWTIILTFMILGEAFPTKSDGIVFHIFIAVFLITHGILLIIIRNYFVSKGL